MTVLLGLFWLHFHYIAQGEKGKKFVANAKC